MSADGMPCRTCGAVTGNPVLIYGRDAVGALVPKQAKCRGRCVRQAPDRQDKPRAARPRTAIRVGLCPACDRDIVPGDVIAGAGDQSFHYECSPNETSRDRSWQQERARTRQGVVV
jgi:hypothetical protein